MPEDLFYENQPYGDETPLEGEVEQVEADIDAAIGNAASLAEGCEIFSDQGE